MTLLSFTKHLLPLLLIAPLAAYCQGGDFTAPIAWGETENNTIQIANFKQKSVSGQISSFESKHPTTINGINFTKTINFVQNKGLSQIAYSSNLKSEPFDNRCMSLNNTLNNLYGQRTNEVHVTDQGLNNYTEIIWTSKLDRIVRLFCYQDNNDNYVTVSIYPRWTVLDCSMHNINDSSKNAKIKRAFFYFDQANGDIRFFNNSNVTLPFKSTFKSQRIEFSHNEIHDHTTIDLNTGVIMSKFANNNGKEELLVGKCKKQ